MLFLLEQLVPLPRNVVFAFHEDPEHLALLHREWTAFRMIKHQGNLLPGSRTWFEANIAGILPVALGFEHTLCQPPLRYGGELIHGPFRKFTHLHEFDEVDAQTHMRVLLDIELPWYYGGELATRIIVAPIVLRAFRLRGEALLKWAQSSDGVLR